MKRKDTVLVMLGISMLVSCASIEAYNYSKEYILEEMKEIRGGEIIQEYKVNVITEKPQNTIFNNIINIAHVSAGEEPIGKIVIYKPKRIGEVLGAETVLYPVQTTWVTEEGKIVVNTENVIVSAPKSTLGATILDSKYRMAIDKTIHIPDTQTKNITEKEKKIAEKIAYIYSGGNRYEVGYNVKPIYKIMAMWGSKKEYTMEEMRQINSMNNQEMHRYIMIPEQQYVLRKDEEIIAIYENNKVAEYKTGPSKAMVMAIHILEMLVMETK